MSEPRDFSDESKCPLCGRANECAVAAGRSPETCWCMTAAIEPDTIASIPAEAQGKICICAQCARAEPADA